MSVWVQPINGSVNPFEVVFSNGMYFDDLIMNITIKRRDMRHPDEIVRSIYSKNSDGEMHELKVGDKVPIPIDGEIGSSYDRPYFFTIEVATAGNLFSTEFRDTSCCLPSMSLNANEESYHMFVWCFGCVFRIMLRACGSTTN